ncbi:hypothetical protein B0I35DRAFT_411862 [Stachybotrys elegans]|uniref:Uncharacterized protein n=1 Tax=Stachybotrys elegans TaxID=80388 RepID=A0A8K0SK47_9HYPO|nr:hypothetical protein B0I35DRAFT_411862 [Stachybotrys elegans]
MQSIRSKLAAPVLSRAVAGRSITTTSRMNLKESSSQTDVDYDKHKQDSLSKQKKGTGHWKPELASDSEEAVKADRNAQGLDPKTLAERTKKAAEETSKAGTSMSDM